MQKFIHKRDKVFNYLDKQILIGILSDFSEMPDSVREPLQANFPDYPTYDEYKESAMSRNFDASFDAFAQDINDYLKTIPDLFPDDIFTDGKPPMEISIYKSTIQEIILNLDRYINLLKTDVNVLKARYFRYITNEVDDLIINRPNTSETDVLSEYHTKIFSAHSIPSKLNPP